MKTRKLHVKEWNEQCRVLNSQLAVSVVCNSLLRGPKLFESTVHALSSGYVPLAVLLNWADSVTDVPAQPPQSWSTLCGTMDCSQPIYSVLGILQARILELVAMPSSKGSSWHRDWTQVSYICLHWQVVSFPLAPPVNDIYVQMKLLSRLSDQAGLLSVLHILVGTLVELCSQLWTGKSIAYFPWQGGTSGWFQPWWWGGQYSLTLPLLLVRWVSSTLLPSGAATWSPRSFGAIGSFLKLEAGVQPGLCNQISHWLSFSAVQDCWLGILVENGL